MHGRLMNLDSPFLGAVEQEGQFATGHLQVYRVEGGREVFII